MAVSEKITEEMCPDDVPQLQCSVGPSIMHDPGSFGASNVDDSKIEAEYKIRNSCSMEQLESIEDGDKYDFSDTESTASVDNHTKEKVDSYREDKGESYIEHPVDSSTKGKTKQFQKGKSHVFVGNLPRNASRAEILEHFSKFRESIMHNPMIIRRKIGTQARLTFSSPAAASDAIESLNQSMFKKSSCISVEPWSNSKNKQKHKVIKAIMSSKQSECDGGPSETTEKATVYVYNLPSSVTNNDVRTHFREFGPHIHKLQVIKDSTVEESKEYARILFTSLKAAQTAVVKLHKSCMPQSQERHITVKIRKEKSDKQSMETESAPEQKELQKASPKEMYPPSSNVQGEHHNGDDAKGVESLESATCVINHTETKMKVSTNDTNTLGNENKQVSLPADIRPTSTCDQSNCVAGVETAEKINVFVHNLPSTVTDDDVRMHFIEFEQHLHKVVVIKDSKAEESKQFALVKFTSLEAAQTAVAKLHNSCMPQFQEKNLSMKIEQGKQPQSPSKECVSKPSQQKKQEKSACEEYIQEENIVKYMECGEDISDSESTISSVSNSEDKTTYVFVGNLPPNAKENDVLEHFSKFRNSIIGNAVLIKYESETHAQLKFRSLATALNAIKLLNLSVFQNLSTISVKLWSSEKNNHQKHTSISIDGELSSAYKSEAKTSVAEAAGNKTEVRVYNLPSSVTNNSLRSYFKEFRSHIHRVQVTKDPTTRGPKGFAVVIFTSLEAAQTAVAKLHNSRMQQSEKPLNMKVWKVKSGKHPMSSEPDMEKQPVQKKRVESPSPKEIKISHPRTSTEVRDPTEQLIGVRVMNVNVSITGDQLIHFLNMYGTVRQYTIMCAPEGKQMYKAVAYFGSKEEADNVIAKLNDEKLAGKHIHIRPLNESTSPLANIPANSLDTYGIHVSEIPKALCKSKLNLAFAKFGNIASIFFKPDDNTAYISYYRLEDAQGALDMNNQEVHGSKLKVSMASTPCIFDDSTLLLSSIPLSPSKPKGTTVSASFTVQIKHLSPVTTIGNLSRIVEVYGALTSRLHVINGNPRYAFVSYATLEAANAAISCLHNQPMDGSRLKVKLKSTSYHRVATPSPPSVPLPTTALSVPSPCSTMKNVVMSTRLYQFLNKQMELKLREFRSFGGSVSWQNNTLQVIAPSVSILNRFEKDVLWQINEHQIVLTSEDWNKLMLMRPDKTSLFHQLVHLFPSDDVYVEPDISSLIMYVVGLKKAVQDLVAAFGAELSKEVIVEQVKMMALIKLDPTLKEQTQNSFGALMEGFSCNSTKIRFTGSSNAVSEAREWFNSILKQYTVTSLPCHKALILSALEHLSIEILSVVLCVKCDDGTICYAQNMAVYTVQVVLLVCGREPFVQRAVEILNHPEERIITFETMDALHKLKSQPSCDFSSLSEQHKVYIHESTGPVLTIQSYSKDCIATVESILNQAKLSLERCCVVLQASKAKIAHLTAAFARHPNQAKIFFDAIHQATSVEILCLDNEVRLTGSMDKIQVAEKMIKNSDFLKGFKCETFEFECHPNFKGQTEKYLKGEFDQRQLDVSVRCCYQKTDKLSRQTSKVDLTKLKSTIFCVEIERIETEYDAHFATACGIVKGLKPETRYIRMPKKEFECLSQAVKTHVLDIEGTHRVRLDLHDKNHKNTAVIHGLTATEINAAEDEIGAYVSANVEVKLTVKVSKHQKYYLTEKCNKLQNNNCKILFPKSADFKKENAGDAPQADITLQGEKCHVEVAKQKIDEILSSLHHRLVKKRHNQYTMMWKRKWEEVKAQEEANSNVVIFTWFDFDEKEKSQKSKKPKEVGVSVEITIIADDLLEVCQVEQNVISIADTMMTRPILVSRNQCKAVADALKNKKLILRESHNVELEIDWDKPELLLLAPSGSSDDFEGAFAALLAFIQGEAVKSDNIKLGEPALSHYIHQKQQWSEIIKVSKQCSVRVKRNNQVLEVSGKVPDVAKAKNQLEQLLRIFKSHLGTQEVSIPSLHEPILKMLEFQNLVSKLKQDLCIVVTFNVQQSSTVTLCKANIQPEGCDRPCFIEICHGNLVNETTDVIVNAANSELQHIGGLAKAISDAGGPAIQAYSDDYVRQNGIVKPGHLACLPAGNLCCSVVMHAVGPMWKDGGHSKKEELYAAVSTSVVESDKRGYRSVSLPAISAGIYGCPVEECALLSIKATVDLLIGNCLKSVSHIRFVLFTWDAANAFQDYFKDCLQENKFKATAEVVAQLLPSSGGKIVWFWEDDAKRLQPYTSQVSSALSRAYSVSPNQAFKVQIVGQGYTIYFADMVQVNNKTQKQRRVHRKTLGAVTWQYKDDNNSWTPYAPEHNDVLEVMYESKVPQRLEIGNWSYAIDFRNMEQINITTRKRRPIRRVLGSVAVPGKPLLKQTSTSASLSLNGPCQNLNQACKMVENCFERCLTSCEIPLSDSLSYLAEKIKRLGHKYNVEAKHISQTKTVTFRGVADGVTKARLAAQDILLSVGCKSNVKFPLEWETDANSPNVEIVEVRPTSHEWRKVSQLVLSTLSQVNVVKIERVQNRWLWEKYFLNCKRMKEKNKGIINEKELFHGTRDTSPDKIYADEEEGFDMRFSRQGMWGQGNYFAEKAEYSDTYAYQGHNGLKKFFLAKVLTGDSILMKPDGNLRMPPLKSGGGNMRYDTVCGDTHGCRVYIAYSNDKAYPFYVITYKYKVVKK